MLGFVKYEDVIEVNVAAPPKIFSALPKEVSIVSKAVSYTHLTLPTNREV